MPRATLEGISPFFIVTDVSRTVAFYRDRLGFSLTFLADADPDGYVLFFGRPR